VKITKQQPQDVRVSIQVECAHGFPWDLESNVDWRDGLAASTLTEQRGSVTETFYQITVDCPLKVAECFYQIPGASKFVNVLFDV
jgi:hypothetical protein